MSRLLTVCTRVPLRIPNIVLKGKNLKKKHPGGAPLEQQQGLVLIPQAHQPSSLLSSMLRESGQIWGASTKHRKCFFFPPLRPPVIVQDESTSIDCDPCKMLIDEGSKTSHTYGDITIKFHQPVLSEWMTGESGDQPVHHIHIPIIQYLIFIVTCIVMYGVWWHVFEIHIRYQHGHIAYIK